MPPSIPLPTRSAISLVLITVTTFLLLSPMKSFSDAASPPNIVVILADDLGWNDIGFNNPDIITPNLDGLARSGVILNQSYVQPMCSPSRSALMTGVYPFRMGLQHLVIINEQPVCAPQDRPFLSEVLKKAGYATHIIGKWHLGFCNKNCTPNYRGFDSFYGYYSAMEDYYTKEWEDAFDFRDNMEVARSAAGNYSTYQLTDRMRKVIAAHDTEKPLFLYLPFQNVHFPLEAPQKYLDMYPNVADKDRRALSGMVTALDDAVGALVESLKQKGMYDNTLIVFSPDNGGSVDKSGNNFPLRGGKYTVFEGGTRVAAFVHGPMLKKTGVRYDGLMHVVDWLPTLVEAAGIQYNAPDIDGVSQWQSLLHQTMPSNRQEVVYNIDDSIFPVQGKAAIRVGDYKLVDGYPGLYPDWYKPAQYTDSMGSISGRQNDLEKGKTFYQAPAVYTNKFLFNLRDDPTEHVNLYHKHPEIVRELRSRLQEHRKKYVKPNFPGLDPESDPKNFGGAWSPGWC